MMKRKSYSTVAEVAQFHGVTEDQVRSLKRAMITTWEGIASDWFAAFEGGEVEALDSFDSEAHMVSEATIDAGLIFMYGQKDLAWFLDHPSQLDLGRAVWTARR